MKNSFDNHIDKLFRDALQFHKKNPGKHIWENIEKELETEEHTALVNKRKPGLKKITALLLLFFFLSSMFVYYALNLVQPHKSVLSVNIKNPAARKLTDKQPEMFYKRSLPIVRNKSLLPCSTVGKETGIAEADLSFSDVTSSTMSPVPNYTLTNPDNVFLSMPMPVIRPSPHLLSAAQNIVRLQEPKFIDRFSFTAYFSQEFAGYNFIDNDITAPNGKEIEKAERNIFSASLGVYLNYKINKKWMVQTGISYSWSRSVMDSSQSYAVMNDAGDVAFKLNTASGFSFLHSPSFIVPMVGDSMGTAKTHSELHYLTVPLIVSYRIPMQRFTFLAGAGMTFNVLTHATLETDIYGLNYKQNETEVPIRGLKKINAGLLLKAEIQYQLTSKMSVSLMPSFKNTLGPINMNSSSLSAYPYNFGIGAGIVYSF